MHFLKITLYFLCIMLAMVLFASIFKYINNNSDYILCSIASGGCGNENIFQRLAFYSVYYFIFSFISGLFLIIFLLSALQIQRHLKVLYILLIGIPLGLYFSFSTRNSIMSLYVYNDEAELRYILVVTICMILFPFINNKLWELFNRKKQTLIS